MTDSTTEDRLDELLAIAADHSTAVSENLARQRQLLEKLERFAPDTSAAVQQIAKDTFLKSAAVLDAQTEKSTTAATRRLTEASDAFRWKTVTMAALVSIAGLVAVLGAFWGATAWQRHELAQLSASVDEMRQNVADLEKRGGKVKLVTCGEKRRLCVQVDTKAGAFSEDLDYFILKGY